MIGIDRRKIPNATRFSHFPATAHALHLLNERATPVCSPLRAVAAEAMVVDNGFGWVK